MLTYNIRLYQNMLRVFSKDESCGQTFIYALPTKDA
jgi:hypothetical protein